MPSAIVLGAGMVGSVMAADMAADASYSVTIVDAREENLAAANTRAGGRLISRCTVIVKPVSLTAAVSAEAGAAANTQSPAIEPSRHHCGNACIVSPSPGRL